MRSQGVLEIEQADAGDAGAAGQPDQVLGVIVAVGEDALGTGRPRLAPRPHRRPQPFPFGDGVRPERPLAGEFRPPLQEQVRAGLQRQVVIGQQRPAGPGPLQALGRRGCVQGDQGVDGGGVERRFVSAGLDQPGVEVVAEILQHRQALGGVGGDDLGRRKPAAAQVVGGGDEGLDASRGQPRRGVVTGGEAFLGRGVRRTGRGLDRWRLVHEDQRAAARCGQPLIAARGGVARQRLAAGVAEAGAGQELGLYGLAVRTQACDPSSARAARSPPRGLGARC